MTKRKDERRELLKEDEIHSRLETIARYIQDEPKKVFGVAAVVLVLMIALFGGAHLQKQGKIAAAGDLYKAEEMLNADLSDETDDFDFADDRARYEAALAEIDAVLDSRSGVVRQQALIMKARCLTSLGRTDELPAIYEELAGASGDMAVFGHSNLAEYHLSKGDYEKALDHLADLQNTGSVSAAWVKYKMAQVHQDKGDVDEAKRLLQEIVDEYADIIDFDRPPVYTQADQLLTELNG